VSSLLPFLVLGLADGSVYALAALGLVVTYKTSGVLNFGHGAIAMVAAYAYYSLTVQAGLAPALAAMIAVVAIGPVVGLLIDRLLFTRLVGSPSATYVVVSVGLLLLLQAIVLLVYGSATLAVPRLFPRGSFHIPGVNVGFDQACVIGIAGVTALTLAVLFRKTRLGLQMRAVVGDAALTSLVGSDPTRIRTISWMLGSSFAALAGVLLAPTLGVDATTLVLLVVQAFAAATVGKLTSLPITYGAAICISIVADVSKKFVAGHESLTGLPTSLPFIILFAVLVLSPRGRFVEVAKVTQLAGARHASIPTGVAWRYVTVFGSLCALLPLLSSESWIVTFSATLPMILMFASLSLLVGTSRQVSLCHAVFFALGATTLSHLTHHGVSWWLALPLSGLLVVPLGAFLAIPALRLSGLFLALATFGFGVLAQNLLYRTPMMFGDQSLVTVARPKLLGVEFTSSPHFFYLTLAVVLAGIVGIEVVRGTRLGRLLRGVADSPIGVQSLGVDPTSARVLAFSLSAALCAVAGGLYVTDVNTLVPSNTGFLTSLLWVAILVSAGPRTIGGSVLAGILLVTVPGILTSGWLLEYQPIVFGLAAILLAQTSNGSVGTMRVPDFSSIAERSAWRRGIDRHSPRLEGVGT
jgi:branched-subunit amino acid ABC-type transport system permease component